MRYGLDIGYTLLNGRPLARPFAQDPAKEIRSQMTSILLYSFAASRQRTRVPIGTADAGDPCPS